MKLRSEQLFTTKQRNQILKLIESAGLQPSDFTFQETVQSYQVTFPRPTKVREIVLVHTPSKYYYHFAHQAEYDSLREVAIFSPGLDSQRDADLVYSWDDHLAGITKWLEYLKRELETPDLWEQVHAIASAQAKQDQPDAKNTPFTSAERAQIEIGLNSLRDEIERRFDTTADKLKDVDRQLNELKNAVGRLGRNDWKHVLRSILINISTRLALEPSQIKDLWAMARTALESVIDGVRGLLS